MSDPLFSLPATRLVSGAMVERYQVVELLGDGGMASVYRVRHVVLGSDHALKVIHPHLLASGDLRHRFLAEGRIQACLRHPHICAVTDIVTDPVPGLVMEYLEGETLGVRMGRSEGPLPVEEILDILLPVLDAVGHAHTRGIIHRDLSPANIILAGDRQHPWVLDFGIARILEDSDLGAGQRTRTGFRLGTLGYMSPEQVEAVGTVDHRSDLFSLGVILYELAVGRSPFAGASERQLMNAIVDGRFQPIPDTLQQDHPHVCEAIRRSLAPLLSDRFPDAAAFSAELGQARHDPVQDALKAARGEVQRLQAQLADTEMARDRATRELDALRMEAERQRSQLTLALAELDLAVSAMVSKVKVDVAPLPARAPPPAPAPKRAPGR